MKRRQTPGAEIRDLLHEMTTGDERIEDIDFSHAALYVLALQLVFSIVVASTSAILTTALVPRPSAVRSLVVSTVLSGLMLLSPLRLGNARGMNRSLEPRISAHFCAFLHPACYTPTKPRYHHLVLCSPTRPWDLHCVTHHRRIG